MRTDYDERKFTELLVHVATRLQGDRSGGATKLNKVLFFADFAHTPAYRVADHRCRVPEARSRACGPPAPAGA
jgi:hypothetical protein